MNIFNGALHLIATTADATAATAGAVGGAAVNGVLGGVRGVVSGVREGASSGSHSTPAAAAALGLIGAAGLVEWPLLLGIGGTALVIHQLRQNGDSPPRLRAASVTGPATNSESSAASVTRRATPRKTTAANKAPASKAPASKAPARKAPAKTGTRRTAKKAAPRTR